MKLFKYTIMAVTAASLTLSLGCGRKDADVAKAAKALEQTFKGSDPVAKQAIAATTEAIRAATTQPPAVQQQHYIQALAPMRDLVVRGNLSKEQVQAVNKVFLEVAAAVQKNPGLATKEMYDAQNAMAKALYSAGVRP